MFPAQKCLLIIAAIVVICGTQQLAQADPLVLTLPNNSLTGVAGGSVTFFATAGNPGTTNASPVMIFDIDLFAPSFLVKDLSPFSANFDNYLLTAGGTLGIVPPLALFTVNIPAGISEGFYSGDVRLLYSSLAGPFFFSNSVAWTVHVVPEPTTMLLLCTGLAGIVINVRKRRKAI